MGKRQSRAGGAGFASSGQESWIQVLLLAGISPDSQDSDGKTLAHYAAEYAVRMGDADVLRKLVDYGSNLYLRDKRGRTVLDILKSSPKLENEVREAWMRGSQQLGIRDSTTTSGKKPLSEGAAGRGRQKRKAGGGAVSASPILERVETLRQGGGKGVFGPLKRPDALGIGVGAGKNQPKNARGGDKGEDSEDERADVRSFPPYRNG